MSTGADSFDSIPFRLSSLKHPNLVHFLGVAQKPDDIVYIVTEFMAKGSLLHYLTTRGRSVISQKDLLSFAVSVSTNDA